ncbi:hypothetical protein QVD99_004330 [Batrachochytrium dendrobatidis]|nr:hypothetical protein O5D80_002082 [Batrachochytrium dendrobatidis]KAK5669957.1 hypothetical protein QVD99_004330 [Batrachochytrium dendrobatidis]
MSYAPVTTTASGEQGMQHEDIDKNRIKDSEKTLDSALGVLDEHQIAQSTTISASTATAKKNLKPAKPANTNPVVASTKKPPTSAKKSTSAAGNGKLNALVNATRKTKKGLVQQVTQGVAGTNVQAKMISGTITEMGGEDDTSLGDQPMRDEKGNIIKQRDDQTGLLQEEDSEMGDSDLDIDEIIHRKEVHDSYTYSCKMLGIVPVSCIVKRAGQQEISMPHHGLGARGAQALAQVLQTDTTLIRLDLTNNFIEGGGAYIGESLKLNRTLTFLNLGDNQMGSASGKAIAGMMAENTTLKTVILRGNKFGDKEATLLAEGLKRNSTLEVLDISHNQIGDLGGIAFGSALAVNETLRDLNVSWNELRSRGTTAMFSGAKESNSLVGLNIQYNGIGENGTAVSLFLARNTSVTHLDIGFTRCSDASMAIISKALETNHNIIELNVSGNPISDATVQELVKSIQSSKIKKLIMKNIRISSKTQANVDRINEENSTSLIIVI